MNAPLEHRSQTPLFTEIAGEFVDYLQTRGEDPEWLAELAHYEWMKTKLHLSDAQPPAHDPEADLLEEIPVLSPLTVPLAYRWPVTQIGPGSIPTAVPEAPTLLLLHRASDHRVRFTQLSAASYRVLVSLAANQWTGREHLVALAQEAGLPEDALIGAGQGMLEQLRRDGIVLGAAKNDQLASSSRLTAAM